MLVFNDTFEVPDILIDHEKCNLCINCVRTCPMQVLKVLEKKVTQLKEICIACRNCHVVCETGALKVHGMYKVLFGKKNMGYISFKGFPEES